MDLEKELTAIMSNQSNVDAVIENCQLALENLTIQKANLEKKIYTVNLYSIVKEVKNCLESGSFDFYDVKQIGLYHYDDEYDVEQLTVSFFDSNKQERISFGIKQQQQQHLDNFDKLFQAFTRIVKTDKFSTYIHNNLLLSESEIKIDVDATMSRKIVEHLLKPDLQKIFNYSLLSSQLNEQSTKSSSKLKI